MAYEEDLKKRKTKWLRQIISMNLESVIYHPIERGTGYILDKSSTPSYPRSTHPREFILYSLNVSAKKIVAVMKGTMVAYSGQTNRTPGNLLYEQIL